MSAATQCTCNAWQRTPAIHRDGCPLAEPWPDGMEMIQQVREAVGLFAGAMPITPKRAWEQALDECRRLRRISEANERSVANRASYERRISDPLPGDEG